MTDRNALGSSSCANRSRPLQSERDSLLLSGHARRSCLCDTSVGRDRQHQRCCNDHACCRVSRCKNMAAASTRSRSTLGVRRQDLFRAACLLGFAGNACAQSDMFWGVASSSYQVSTCTMLRALPLSRPHFRADRRNIFCVETLGFAYAV